MHSYVKLEDGTYSVGQWLPSQEGNTFLKLFDVGNQRVAMAAVNMLNGGRSDLTFTVLKEH